MVNYLSKLDIKTNGFLYYNHPRCLLLLIETEEPQIEQSLQP